MRNMQKALLCALLTPHGMMRGLQDASDYTRLMMLSEELKFSPLRGRVGGVLRTLRRGRRRGLVSPKFSHYEKDVLQGRN